MDRPAKEVVDDCINAVMDHLTVGNAKIVNAATDALILYARNKEKLLYLDNVKCLLSVRKICLLTAVVGDLARGLGKACWRVNGAIDVQSWKYVEGVKRYDCGT